MGFSIDFSFWLSIPSDSYTKSISLELTFSINLLVALLPTNTCVAYEKSCTLEHNNLIGFHTDISHIDECELLCAGEFECKFASYFGPDSYPVTNSCALLKFCSTLDNCKNFALCEMNNRNDNIAISSVRSEHTNCNFESIFPLLCAIIFMSFTRIHA